MRAYFFFGGGVMGALAALVFACGSDGSSDQPPAGDDGGLETGIQETGGGDTGVDAGPPAATDPAGGSRIKVRSIETDDGARIFSSLYDSTLATECGVGYLDDDSLRCLPNATAAVGSFYGPGCVDKLAVADKSACDLPAYAREYISGGNACSNKQAIYRLGAKTTTVFLKNASSCDPVTLDPAQDYYTLGAKVAPAELVAFSIQNVPASPSLAVRMYVGEDGSRARIASQLFDLVRNQPCIIGLGADGKPRCLPASDAQAVFFGDTGCSTRIGVTDECHPKYELADTTTAIDGEPSSACSLGLTYHVFPTTTPRVSKDIYNKMPGGRLGPTTSTTNTLDLGPEIAAATFPEITYDTKPGTTRILQKIFTSAGAPLSDRVTLTDATLGVSCSFTTAADSKLRCLPTVAYVGSYSDALCSTPLASDSSKCEPVKYATSAESTACSAINHVATIGAKIDPPPADRWFGTPADCNKAGSGPGTTDFYAVGAEVPPTTFAEGHLVTR